MSAWLWVRIVCLFTHRVVGIVCKQRLHSEAVQFEGVRREPDKGPAQLLEPDLLVESDCVGAWGHSQLVHSNGTSRLKQGLLPIVREGKSAHEHHEQSAVALQADTPIYIEPREVQLTPSDIIAKAQCQPIQSSGTHYLLAVVVGGDHAEGGVRFFLNTRID